MTDLDKFHDIDEERREYHEQVVKSALAEFVGVTLFVFIGVLSVQSGHLVTVGLAHGFTIALLICGFGSFSGGHFNPAVTLCVALSRGITWPLAAIYIVVQLLGGMLGAAFVRAILPSETYKAINGGAHDLGPNVKPGWAIMAEAILTFVLVLTVLLNAVNEKTKNKFAPFVIGLAVAVDIMAAGGTTGASMNPARSFGPSVVATPIVSTWTHHYVYWIGPVIGAFLAAGCNWVYETKLKFPKIVMCLPVPRKRPECIN